MNRILIWIGWEIVFMFKFYFKLFVFVFLWGVIFSFERYFNLILLKNGLFWLISILLFCVKIYIVLFFYDEVFFDWLLIGFNLMY